MITGVLLMCMNLLCFDGNGVMWLEMKYPNDMTYESQDYAVDMDSLRNYKRYRMNIDYNNTEISLMCFDYGDVPSQFLNSNKK